MNAIELIRSAVAQSDNLWDLDETPGVFKDRDRLVVRASARIDQSVKLGAGGEFFWVEVVDRTEAGVFFGRVANTLRLTEFHGLSRDDIVIFEARHIRVVEPDERFPAPPIFDKPLIMLMGAGKPAEYADPMGGDLMTLEDFLSGVEDTMLTDYDGHGYAVRNTIACTSETFQPSDAARLPEGTTHVLWFNK